VFSFPREVTETASTHVIGDRAEQVYRRCDALEQLTETWGLVVGPKLRTTQGRFKNNDHD
jgi:hypothetical protein